MPGLPPLVGGEAKPVLVARVVELPERLPNARRVRVEGRYAYLFCVTARVRRARLKGLKMCGLEV
jgi:hypothetical protein